MLWSEGWGAGGEIRQRCGWLGRFAGAPAAILLAGFALVFRAGAAAAEVVGSEVETVGLGAALVMLLFLAIAALVVISFVAKLLLAFGLVPKSRTSRLRKAIVFLARATGTVRTTAGGRTETGRPTPVERGGGSSGGAGASGDY